MPQALQRWHVNFVTTNKDAMHLFAFGTVTRWSLLLAKSVICLHWGIPLCPTPSSRERILPSRCLFYGKRVVSHTYAVAPPIITMRGTSLALSLGKTYLQRIAVPLRKLALPSLTCPISFCPVACCRGWFLARWQPNQQDFVCPFRDSGDCCKLCSSSWSLAVCVCSPMVFFLTAD